MKYWIQGQRSPLTVQELSGRPDIALPNANCAPVGVNIWRPLIEVLPGLFDQDGNLVADPKISEEIAVPPADGVQLLRDRIRSSLIWIIGICVAWSFWLYLENLFVHAYFKHLTLTAEIREKLSSADVNLIAELTGDRFQNSYISFLAPLLIAIVASYGLWCVRGGQKPK